MTWGRYDDGWTDRPVWAGVDHASRWHLMCLIQLCCRTERWDGRIPLSTALRASDVDDPNLAHDMLTAAKLLRIRGDVVTVLDVEDHILPEYLRSPERKKKQTKRKKVSRERTARHRDGDHSTCLAGNCPFVQTVLRPVTRPVTRDETRDQHAPDVTRDGNGDPGRVGSGRGTTPGQEPTTNMEPDNDWHLKATETEPSPW